MISFGKVENIVIIDKYGLDKKGFEHLISLDEEAMMQRDSMMRNESTLRIAHVQYRSKREVEKALDLGEIKYRGKRIKFYRFLSQLKSFKSGNGVGLIPI